MKTTPWYSLVGDTYHTEVRCIHGQYVRSKYRREGTGRRWRCGYCERIERRCQRDEGGKEAGVTQYWLVGAWFEGQDHTEVFVLRGYWELSGGGGGGGMVAGDGLAIKAGLGYGVPNIQIKAVGVIKDIDDDGRVYVDWKMVFEDQERVLPSRGAFSAVNGPYEFDAHEGWIKDIFRLV